MKNIDLKKKNQIKNIQEIENPIAQKTAFLKKILINSKIFKFLILLKMIMKILNLRKV